MRSLRTLGAAVALAAGLICGTAAASAPADLRDFVGARAGQAEGGLAARGYALARTQGLTAFWRNATTGVCARIVTSNGRFQSVTRVPPAECGQQARISRLTMRLGELACRNAVARQANRNVRDTSVAHTRPTPEGGVNVLVALKGAARPWTCTTDSKPKVINAMFLGEG